MESPPLAEASGNLINSFMSEWKNSSPSNKKEIPLNLIDKCLSSNLSDRIKQAQGVLKERYD